MKTMIGCAVVALIVAATGYAPTQAPVSRPHDEVADLRAQIDRLREELRIARLAPAPVQVAAPSQVTPARQATTPTGHWERRTTYGLLGRARGSYSVWVPNQATYSSGGGCASGSCRTR